MVKLRKLLISKIAALILGIFMLGINLGVYSQEDGESSFLAALYYYRLGQYETAVSKIEEFFKEEEKFSPQFQARVYLLMGACNEMLGLPDAASTYFTKIKNLLDGEAIRLVPRVPGVDTSRMTEFRKILSRREYFAHKKPVEVSKVLTQDRVVHAPSRSIKQYRKKKFPLGRLLVSAVVVVGIYTLVKYLSKPRFVKLEFPKMEWVYIPPGEFLMGDNFNEGDPDESPVHKVYLKGYYISKFEITEGQFEYYKWDTGQIELVTDQEIIIGARNDKKGFPMAEVDWGDAVAFTRWMSAVTGRDVHLPTEAQWEKAARGTGQLRYPWGNTSPDCNRASYYGCGSGSSLDGKPRRVDYFESGQSPYGVYNMAGNMAEWCLDWYDPSYYTVSPYKNPQGPDSGTYRVVRGGGLLHGALEIRSANRLHYRPNAKSEGLGFRVVMEAE